MFRKRTAEMIILPPPADELYEFTKQMHKAEALNLVDKFLALNTALKEAGFEDKDERYRIIEIIY